MLTTGNDRFRSGLDVVVEGSAIRTTDDSLLKRLAAIWASKLEWAFDVADGAFHDRSTETGGTAHVYAKAPPIVSRLRQGRTVQPDPLPLLVVDHRPLPRFPGGGVPYAVRNGGASDHADTRALAHRFGCSLPAPYDRPPP